MSNVSTSGSLIRDAVKLCNGTIEILSGTQRDMQRKYRNAGNDWSDSKYQQLGDIVNECSSSIRKTLHELKGCLASLNSIEQIVTEYESVNISGNVSTISNYDNSGLTNDRGIHNVSNTIQLGIAGMFGGSAGDCWNYSTGRSGSEQVHHMPADSISPLRSQDGPAVIVSEGDHKNTASFDNKPGARAYREKQAQLIREGKLREAMQMDIDDIREKFGGKYDNGINAALLYLEQLISEGRI
jgi:hypothetical protein